MKMDIQFIDNGSVSSPLGFLAAGVTAGFKRSGAPDMALLASECPCRVAGAFTANLFAAAPVTYDRQILSGERTVRAVVINSGIANACTGARGLEDSRKSASLVAEALGVKPEEVLVASTGRIGDFLPMDTMAKGVKLGVEVLSSTGGAAAARAIMTTDTRPKSFAVRIDVGGKTVTLGGMTKGAGMICPRLRPAHPKQATMLAFVTTDANISVAALRASLDSSIDCSFNRITIDGDTSTNDTFLVLANGKAGNAEIQPGSPEQRLFAEALSALAGRLAKEMVKDGEGVTRFVEVNVTGAKSDADARICAEAIANSELCKTAWFGADPNWGRILCAAGYSGIAFDPAKVNLDLQHVATVRNGQDAKVATEEELGKLCDAPEVIIDLDLGSGNGKFTEWTCDLTYQYEKINADYHT